MLVNGPLVGGTVKGTTVTIDRPQSHAEHPDEPTDGDWGTQFPFSQPGDWVSLADISHGAKALYTVYCGHVNKKRNGNGVWPSQASLANILRCTEKTIRKWNAELEHIEAIVVTEVIDPRNGHKRLFAEVNQAAPSGYDGYVDYKTYYDDQKALRQNMKATLIEVAAASDPRTPPVKSTEGQGEKIPVATDQAKHEPPVKSTEGLGSKSTEGLGSKSTGEEYEVKKTKGRTHTPASPEATGALAPEADTSVCVDPEQDTELRSVLAHSLSVSKAFDLVVADERRIILGLARQCLHAGVTTDTIGARLSLKINKDTTEPYGWALKILQALLDNARTTDPLAVPGAKSKPENRPVWIDPAGNPWDAQDPRLRPCKGMDCSDISGKRYVSIENPTEGAFSCPTCKKRYAKEATTA